MIAPQSWTRGPFILSTDRSKLHFPTIAAFLQQSYWAADRPEGVIRRSIEHSLCFGLYHLEHQVGFCRVVTDYATFGYVADVYVDETCRGQGLGTWMMEIVIAHPDLQGFRKWILATRDAHALYRKVGFDSLACPERFMERNGAVVTV